jgi:hypothetical protein
MHRIGIVEGWKAGKSDPNEFARGRLKPNGAAGNRPQNRLLQNQAL